MMAEHGHLARIFTDGEAAISGSWRPVLAWTASIGSPVLALPTARVPAGLLAPASWRAPLPFAEFSSDRMSARPFPGSFLAGNPLPPTPGRAGGAPLLAPRLPARRGGQQVWSGRRRIQADGSPGGFEARIKHVVLVLNNPFLLTAAACTYRVMPDSRACAPVRLTDAKASSAHPGACLKNSRHEFQVAFGALGYPSMVGPWRHGA